jgi:hypothetical protein
MTIKQREGCREFIGKLETRDTEKEIPVERLKIKSCGSSLEKNSTLIGTFHVSTRLRSGLQKIDDNGR